MQQCTDKNDVIGNLYALHNIQNKKNLLIVKNIILHNTQSVHVLQILVGKYFEEYRS